MRVVSLIPSATEIVALLGGEGSLVGRSHECNHPRGVESARVLTSARTHYDPVRGDSARDLNDTVSSSVGLGRSLYMLDEQGFTDLCPDLVITQDLCGVCSIDAPSVERAIGKMDSKPEVLVLNPESIEDIMDDIVRVGRAMGLGSRAMALVVGLRARMDHAEVHVNPYDDTHVVGFMEWCDPIYVAGHWNVQLIERAGGRHPLNPTRIVPGSGAAVGPQQAQRIGGKSIAVDRAAFVGADPRSLVIAPCGLSLDQVRSEYERLVAQDWFASMRCVREGRVALVDGDQMFNRPGPRVVDALEFMVGFVSGVESLIPGDFPWVRVGG